MLSNRKGSHVSPDEVSNVAKSTQRENQKDQGTEILLATTNSKAPMQRTDNVSGFRKVSTFNSGSFITPTPTPTPTINPNPNLNPNSNVLIRESDDLCILLGISDMNNENNHDDENSCSTDEIIDEYEEFLYNYLNEADEDEMTVVHIVKKEN